MTDIADCPPATDEIDSFLAELEEERLDDIPWVDAEFYAIVAANWPSEPPDPPGPPTGLPGRWVGPGRTTRPRSDQWLTDPVVVGDHHRCQRSPPH